MSPTSLLWALSVMIAITLSLASDNLESPSRSHPESEYKRTRTIRRFGRPAATPSSNHNSLSLPEFYSDLGPNVRASGSFRRPSRRIGLAYQHENDQGIRRYRMSRQESSMATSQPDISSAIVSSPEKSSAKKLAERMADFRKRSPLFRKNRFGSRTTEKEQTNDSEKDETLAREINEEDHSRKSAETHPDNQNDDENNSPISDSFATTEQSTYQRRRPFPVKRPYRNKFDQVRKSQPSDEERNTPTLLDARFEKESNQRIHRNREQERRVNSNNPGNSFSEDRNERSGSEINNYSRRPKPTNDDESKKGIKQRKTTSFATSQFSFGKPDGQKQNSRIEVGNEPEQDEENVNLKGSRNTYEQITPSAMKPSNSDDGKDWHPNSPTNPEKEISEEEEYEQYPKQNNDVALLSEREQKKNNIRGEQGLYRNDVRQISGNFRQRTDRPEQNHNLQKPAHRVRLQNSPQHYRNSIRKHPNKYDIPDLSLNSEHNSNKVPIRSTHRNSNVLTELTTSYQEVSRPPIQRKTQRTDWAFDPKWAVTTSPEAPSTERILMEPTKVPGSSHLVARNEFPYNFWRPANANRANEGIYPRSRQGQNENSNSGFREVPEYLFTVGAGPVTIPEELVRNTYEMVTAAPSFDILSNPFESGNSPFNSIPENENLQSIDIPFNENLRRMPNRFNRHRRPNEGRGNPLRGIMNMVNPRPTHRVPISHVPYRPNNIEHRHNRQNQHHHSPRPSIMSIENEIGNKRIHHQPHFNSVRPSARPTPHAKPMHHKRPGHTATKNPGRAHGSTGAVGFTHFTHQNSQPKDRVAKLQRDRIAHRQVIDNKKNSFIKSEELENIQREHVASTETEQHPSQEEYERHGQDFISVEHRQRDDTRITHREPMQFVPNRVHPNHIPNSHPTRRHRSRGRPLSNGPRGPGRQHPSRRPPHSGRQHPGQHSNTPPQESSNSRHRVLIQQPNWIRDVVQDISPFKRPSIKPVNPHSKYVTTNNPEHITSSHFDVKHYDINESQGSHNAPSVELGNREGFFEPNLEVESVNYRSNPRNEQISSHHNPHNRQNTRPHPIQHYQVRWPKPNHRPYNFDGEHQSEHRQPYQDTDRQEEEEPQSIWSALTNFDFSFLNPFGSYDYSEYTDDVDRVSSAAAVIPAALLVPGGIAVLGAGLGLFYFNFVWAPTTVVRARLMNVLMRGTHSSVLTDEQQQAIGDVTKVYSALSDIGAKFANVENSLAKRRNESLLHSEGEPLMSQDCKNRLVCQTYYEFDDLLEVTKGAATLLKGTLRHLDQDLLLEFFLAADRGHHLPINIKNNESCSSYYPACSLSQISIKSALRDLAGINHDPSPLTDNHLGLGEVSASHETVEDFNAGSSKEITTQRIGEESPVQDNKDNKDDQIDRSQESSTIYPTSAPNFSDKNLTIKSKDKIKTENRSSDKKLR